MYRETKELYEFGPFRLNVEEHTLTRTDGPINDLLPEKAFLTLCVLVQKGGHLLTKQELLTEIWPDSFVEENNLDKCIHAIRQVLGEKPGENKYIETVRKHGYRFVAPVNSVGTPHESATSVLDSEFLTEWTPNSTGADNGRVIAPERSSWTPWSAVVVGIIFVVAAIASGYFLYPAKDVAAKKRMEFAVLPMNPIDPANRSNLYEIGIAESLIHQLSSTKGLIVRPMSAVRGYSDVEQDALAAGREQKVDYVLASNYQIADGKIRITSKLLNVATGQIAETYKSEKEVANIFAMQDAIAGDVGNKLARFFGVTVGPAANRGTDNQEAYGLYIQGTVLVGKRTQESSGKAIEYLEQAVRLDPNYALAYARLAHAYDTHVYTGGTKNGHEDYLKAKAAIEKALAIDPDLAEAHSYLGEMKINYDADLEGAEREHKLAVELNPNSSTAHCMYALLLSYLGRSDEAIAEIKTAIDLEPASAENHHTYAFILFLARRYDEAITEAQRLVETDSEYFFAYNVLRNCYQLKGDDDNAFEAFVHMNKPEDTDSLKVIYSRSGSRGISEHELEYWKAAEKTGNRNNNKLALHSIELGYYEEAFAYLEKAFVERRPSLVSLKVNPRYDPLRSDPRFDDLLKRIGFR